MSVSLTLLPILGKDMWVAHTSFRLEDRSELWPIVSELPTAHAPNGLTCHFARRPSGDHCYGHILSDPYGGPLQWVSAGALVSLADHPAVKDVWKNRAAWAYLEQMPADWPVVLYWH